VELIVGTGQATRRHFVLVRVRGLSRRTLKTITHHAQTHARRQTTRGQSAKSVRCHRPKPISCHFYSKQNGVHGLISSSLIGRVTCHYTTGLDQNHFPFSRPWKIRKNIHRLYRKKGIKWAKGESLGDCCIIFLLAHWPSCCRNNNVNACEHMSPEKLHCKSKLFDCYRHLSTCIVSPSSSIRRLPALVHGAGAGSSRRSIYLQTMNPDLPFSGQYFTTYSQLQPAYN